MKLFLNNALLFCMNQTPPQLVLHSYFSPTRILSWPCLLSWWWSLGMTDEDLLPRLPASSPATWDSLGVHTCTAVWHAYSGEGWVSWAHLSCWVTTDHPRNTLHLTFRNFRLISLSIVGKDKLDSISYRCSVFFPISSFFQLYYSSGCLAVVWEISLWYTGLLHLKSFYHELE